MKHVLLLDMPQKPLLKLSKSKQLSDSYQIHPENHFNIDRWKSSIGQFMIDKIKKADIHIEGTNDEKLINFCQAILLMEPGIFYSGWRIDTDDSDQITNFQEIPPISYKIPFKYTSSTKLEKIAKLAEKIDLGMLKNRITKSHYMFQSSMREDKFLDESLLKLIMSIEGIIHSENSRDFVKKIEIYIR